MNPKLEKALAIFGMLVFSGVIAMGSYGRGSDGAGGSAGGSNPFDKIMVLFRYAYYAYTLFMLTLRLKTVVRPALRDVLIWGLMGIIVMSHHWSDFPNISEKNGQLTVLTTLFGLYIASRYNMKEQMNILQWTFGISVVFSLLYSGALPNYGIEQGTHKGAWRGPLLHKNHFSRFMAISTVPLLFAALKAKKHRRIMWGIFILSVLMVQLSTSKTGLLVFLTLMLLVPLCKALQSTKSVVVPFLIVIVLIGASAATWLVSNWEPFLYGLGKDPTLTGRTDIWEFVIDKIKERPWLGFGYEAFWLPGGEGENVKFYIFLVLSQAHNGYLDVAVHLGLIGFALWFGSLILCFFRGLIWTRVGGEIEDLWPLLYVIFLLVYNNTESTIVETNSFFWILYVSASFSMKRIRAVIPGAWEVETEEVKIEPKKLV
ncbi:O-antigen ligase family protein [Floridanema aerugineum]|uniref:O-antigen ligase family protein n=1 Tax=Floridaenema aerugineum BLCC-F46 TaxID=3153654 RepID=A0ABV4WZ60_9CYAN